MSKVTTREKFEALNRFVTKRDGWITSSPGAETLRIECLPGSSLPDELNDLGYRLTPAGEGQRLLAHAITERFLIVGSTVERVRHHAGIVGVLRFEFNIP